MSVSPAPSEPLLEAMRDLVAAYSDARVTTEALIAAFVAGRMGDVYEAVNAYTFALAAIDTAERRRVVAETALAAGLSAEELLAEGRRGAITCSDLFALLPPHEAATLRTVRRELLVLINETQDLNRQATMLLRGGQAVVNRLVCATLPQTPGYGPRGQLMQPRLDVHPRAARLA